MVHYFICVMLLRTDMEIYFQNIVRYWSIEELKNANPIQLFVPYPYVFICQYNDAFIYSCINVCNIWYSAVGLWKDFVPNTEPVMQHFMFMSVSPSTRSVIKWLGKVLLAGVNTQDWTWIRSSQRPKPCVCVHVVLFHHWCQLKPN